MSLLRLPGFRNLWLGQSVSLLGDQISFIALPLAAVLVLDAGAGQMGLLGAAALAPHLLLSLPAGVWLDRVASRRRVMIATDLARAVLLATIPLAYALDALSFAQLYAVAFLTGCLAVFFDLSYPTLFVSVTPRERFLEGNSLVHGSRSFSFVAGPSLGGLLVQLFSAPFALLADAVSFLGSALFLGRVRAEEPPVDQAAGAGIRAQAAEGLRFIGGNPIFRPTLTAVATLNFFNYAFQALFILYATRTLGVSAGALGLVLGVAALGGICGAVVAGRVGRRLGVGPRLRPRVRALHGPARPRPARAGAGGPRPRLPLRGRVPLRARRHDPRRQRRLDHVRPDPRPAPLAGHRRLQRRQLGHPAPRRARRRRARGVDRRPADALGGDGRGAPRLALAAPVAGARAPRAARGGRVIVARSPAELPPGDRAVAVGTFDGVHRGHRAVIEAATATGLRSTVLTFDPHPRLVLGYGVQLLTTLERRIELIEEIGPDELLVVEFTQALSRTEPEQFVADVLAPVGTRIVLAGEGFRFGAGRRGDAELLRRLGIEVRPVPILEGVSSSRIRELVAAGDVGGAAALLGRPFELEGVVVAGDQRGGTLGFPTANLALDPHLIAPAYGIYAGEALGHRAAASVGVNPHYGGSERRIEAFLLDFEGDLYGRRLRLELWERLRDERSFGSEEELVAQIARDVDAARAARRPAT